MANLTSVRNNRSPGAHDGKHWENGRRKGGGKREDGEKCTLSWAHQKQWLNAGGGGWRELKWLHLKQRMWCNATCMTKKKKNTSRVWNHQARFTWLSQCTWEFSFVLLSMETWLPGWHQLLKASLSGVFGGWPKPHYRGNDPLSHEVDKGWDSCPSKPSQSTIQLCYTPSKPTAACVQLLPLVYLRVQKRVCLHLCARVCPGKG